MRHPLPLRLQDWMREGFKKNKDSVTFFALGAAQEVFVCLKKAPKKTLCSLPTHNFMAAADSAVVLLELDDQWD